MAQKTKTKRGRYLYAITNPGERSYGACGIEGGAVYAVSNGRLAAIVSDLFETKIRPQRRHLAAHQEVLNRLMKESTPLPMVFGTIAEGPEAIKKILSLKQKDFLLQLRRVAEKTEMGLRVYLDVPNIFEYFVHTHPELRLARDRLLGTHREPRQEDKIEVGRIFERILNEDREEHSERVEEILKDCCIEIKRTSLRNEREIVNLACLVERNSREAFEAGIFKAAGLFDNNFAFDYNGPWAPHNFVEVNIRL